MVTVPRDDDRRSAASPGAEKTPMRIELHVQLETRDGEERIYRLSVDRPYSRVPTAGELVQIDEAERFGLTIDHVALSNDGTAEPWFVLSDDDFATADELLEVGYERVDIGAVPEDDEPA
jgi:hypothetical protein